LKKFSIIFTTENRNLESELEKMSVVLATSIRTTMPDVDIYCGVFTDNKLSYNIVSHLENLNVKIINDNIFYNVKTDNLFLRPFCQKYFAEKLLDQYEYLVYIDVDCIFLKPLEFNFDPTEPIVLVDHMPKWVKAFESTYTKVTNDALYYNWISIVNNHNKHIFDLDYTDPNILFEKNADIAISKSIENSSLEKIQQTIGAYHCLHPVTLDTQVIHYDDFMEDGSLLNLRPLYLNTYIKYKLLIENVLGVKIRNVDGYWEKIKDMYS
jgi:hypothetical protein